MLYRGKWRGYLGSRHWERAIFMLQGNMSLQPTFQGTLVVALAPKEWLVFWDNYYWNERIKFIQ